ncbi:ABC transporter ATP-binding protein [Symbiobacterium thermophilum]|uniref:ABC transporter ATP-binding protein n=1 Tax=Symbiobacterium thermophilum TaxID=2734 RepID=A0A953LJS3_SYMTR|nr:ABC transporter ATP-binding protein [Symbiobacterium thermophilum]MBY6277504.1 ABC transporter ATP-binding protein [Symbiobacterium thermophilum]
MRSLDLVTRDLSKRFGERWALRGLSFAAVPGSVTLLAGRNGAGKTTWMRVATGLAHPSSGAVLFGGWPAGRVRTRLAAVFDDAPVYPLLTGAENLEVLSGGCPLRTAPARALVDELDLGSLLPLRADGLSFGQRKRLAVAAALLRRPSWLLLDEPSVGLDSGAWGAVAGTLRRLAAEGACIVVTGQDLKNLEELADQIVVIRDGAAVFAGTRAELQRLHPPRVRVRTPAADRLRALFPQAEVLAERPVPCLEIPCASGAEGEALLARIRALAIPLQSLELRAATLEETFRRLGLYGGEEQQEVAP